jgi:hypothetical protein
MTPLPMTPSPLAYARRGIAGATGYGFRHFGNWHSQAPQGAISEDKWAPSRPFSSNYEQPARPWG